MKSLKVVVSPPNSRHARRLFHPRKPQANGTRGPPGVNNDGSRFPAKSNQLETLFFFNLDHSVERWERRHNNGQSCLRQRKTRVKAGTCINKRRTSFLTLYAAKFGSTATSLFEIWMPAWSSADTARFHRGLFFSFRDRMVLLLSSLDLFLILFFFY